MLGRCDGCPWAGSGSSGRTSRRFTTAAGLRPLDIVPDGAGKSVAADHSASALLLEARLKPHASPFTLMSMVEKLKFSDHGA